MNTTYYRLELRRILRDRTTLFFTLALPAFLFVLIGATPDYAADEVGDGNVAMWMMIAMAAYGAVTATTSVGGSTALERMQGWGRQLGLTPMRDHEFIVVKAAVAMTVALGAVVTVYTVGFLTGAEAPLAVWFGSGALLIAGAVTFAFYGLNFGLAFRSEAAVSAAAGFLVILAFLGNLFIPLGGWQLTAAKFTPLYGYVALARRPLTGGGSLDPDTGDLVDEPLWQVLANLGVWTLALGALAVMLVARGRERQ